MRSIYHIVNYLYTSINNNWFFFYLFMDSKYSEVQGEKKLIAGKKLNWYSSNLRNRSWSVKYIFVKFYYLNFFFFTYLKNIMFIICAILKQKYSYKSIFIDGVTLDN